MGIQNQINKFPVTLPALLVLFFIMASCNNDQPAAIRDETGRLKDIDGNSYITVAIGNMEWMAENLRTTKFNDGSPIDNPGPDNRAWQENIKGAYSWYKNNRSDHIETFGALYNWHAVNSGKLCPPGWRVPTDDDWTMLSRILAADPSYSLKPDWNIYGEVRPAKATEIAGFNAVPSGVRYSLLPGGSQENREGYFYNLGKTGRWWTTTERSAEEAWARSVYHDSGSIFRGSYKKEDGFSVRCVRNK